MKKKVLLFSFNGNINFEQLFDFVTELRHNYINLGEASFVLLEDRIVIDTDDCEIVISRESDEIGYIMSEYIKQGYTDVTAKMLTSDDDCDIDEIYDEDYENECEDEYEDDECDFTDQVTVTVYKAKDDGVIYMSSTIPLRVEKDRLYIARTINGNTTIRIESTNVPLVEALEQYFEKVDSVEV